MFFAILCNNTGFPYYNYSHSIILLAIYDANYVFTFVDIGVYGRRCSAGGIFQSSLISISLNPKFLNKKMNLPELKPISADGELLSYMLAGDKAFLVSEYLLRL